MAEPRTYDGNGLTAKIADPKNITRDECLELAKCGAAAWNKWRGEFSSRFARTSDPFGAIQSSSRGNCADFSGIEFDGSVDFSRFEFGAGAKFEQTTFHKESDFRFSKFDDGCDFSFCKFLGPTIFSGSTFQGSAQFTATEFLAGASFQSARFGTSTRFAGAKFDEFATFVDCAYPSEDLDFEEVDFNCRNVDFSRATFSREKSVISNASFGGAHFSGDSNFSGLQFVGVTNFSKSRLHARNSRVKKGGQDCWLHWEAEERFVAFSQPPWFFNTNFEEDVSFDGAKFPPATGFETSARAYRVLKLAFSEQQATREEQRFFKLEMQEEAASENGWKRWLYSAYEVTSDFGFSVWRPLVTLVLLPALVGMFLYLLCMSFHHPKLWLSALAQDSALTSEWLQFSFANMAPLPDGELLKDLRTDLFGSSTYAAFFALKLETLQKVLALAGYFLFGLALRNLFKMK